MEHIKLNKLFLIVLGGRTSCSHIELHDVRWAVGKTIEETYGQLRKEWFGKRAGLHIDSYMEIKYIDGYKISLRRNPDRNKFIVDNTSILKDSKERNYLWFVNLGGYHPSQLNELHEFGLLVADSSKQAQSKASNRYLKSIKFKHKDDCYSIKNVQDWQVELTQDAQKRSQVLKPDWYGYLNIEEDLQLNFIS